MNDQVEGDGDDAHLISDHELYRQIIAETVATVPCTIKSRAKTPKTKPLGEVRSDVVSLIASRGADFVCSDDNKDLTQDARNLLVIKLTNDICTAFPQAQPKSGYTNSHFDTAKLVIPAFINHGHYSQHLRAYAKLCQISQGPIDLGTLSLPASYVERDMHTLDNQLTGETATGPLADAFEDNPMPLRPIKDLEKRLNAMMDAVNANVKDLFQDDHNPDHHNSRNHVWHKLEILKTLKDSILQEAAERETHAPDAFGTPGHELKDYQWKLSPRGYAQLFLTCINYAANPRSNPHELEEEFKRGSKDRDGLRDSLQQAEADKKKISGWRPEIVPSKYNTTFIGMHPEDIAAGKEITVTTTLSQHPDPTAADNPHQAAQDRAVAQLRAALVESIKAIPCDPEGATAQGTPPRTIGSMSRRSKPLRESIEHVADRVMAMLHEPQFKDLHVGSGMLLLSKLTVDLTQTAAGMVRSDAASLSKHKFIREFLDEIATNIDDRNDDYGRYIRAYTRLCADIRDPLVLNGTFMTPEGFAYADAVTRKPLPFDGGDVSAPAGRGLPNMPRAGEDEHPVDHKGEREEHAEGPNSGGHSLFDMEMRTPLVMLPREELSRRLDTMMEHTRKHAFALFNISAPALGTGSDVEQKLQILEKFKEAIYADAKKEVEGTAELPSGTVPRSQLFDPFWNITVQGYCNMFLHGIERACSRIKPDRLAKDLSVGSTLWEKMHEVETDAIAAMRAAPGYEPSASICLVKHVGTLPQPELRRDQPVMLQ